MSIIAISCSTPNIDYRSLNYCHINTIPRIDSPYKLFGDYCAQIAVG